VKLKPLLISKRQFWAWGACSTVAWVFWILGPGLWDWLALLILNFSSLLLMTPVEREQPLPGKELVWIVVSLILFGLLLWGIKVWFPGRGDLREPAIVSIIHHPAVVVPFWALLFWVVYRYWKSSVAKSSQ